MAKLDVEHIIAKGNQARTKQKQYPLPIQPVQCRFSQEMHAEAATLLWMANVNALFNSLLLNKEEAFNVKNIEQYTEYIKKYWLTLGT